MNDAARARSHQEMAGLQRRRNELAEWIGGMRHGPTDAWNEVKAGFVRSPVLRGMTVTKLQGRKR